MFKFTKSDFINWIQANMAVLGAIILVKLSIFNSADREIFNLWWTMILPTLALMVSRPINYFSERADKKHLEKIQFKDSDIDFWP